MKQYYFDASIVLEVLIDGPLAKSCSNILEKIQTAEIRAVTNIFTVAELYHLLAYREKQNLSSVKDKINDFIELKGLIIVEFDSIKLTKAIDIATRYKIDFVDSTHKVVMQELNIKNIYSLDSHFDKFKNINRLY